MPNIEDQGDVHIGKFPSMEKMEGVLKAGFDKIVEPSKDEIKVSEEEALLSPPSDCDKPRISAPNAEKTNEANLKKAATYLKNNPWLIPSFLVVFSSVMFEIMKLQQTVRFKEAQIELLVRQHLWDLAKSNAVLARTITESQAYEKFVQAVASFVTAAISGISSMASLKNLGKAAKQMDEQTAAQKRKLDEAKAKENPAVKAQDLPVNPTKDQHDKHFKDLDDNIKKDNTGFKYSDDIKKQEEAYKNLEYQRESNVSNRERTLSQITQMKSEAWKSTIQGMSGVLTALITLDRAKMEELKGYNEGMIQAMNKYSETSSKARDDAKAMFDRISDFIAKIVDSYFKAHSISGRG